MLPIDPPLSIAKLERTPAGPYPAADLDPQIADLLDELADREGPEQAACARNILARDPENVEALAVLSEHAECPAEALALLREAVRVGRALWEGEDVTWWWNPGTRPYMRAILAYGEALAAAGQTQQAALCFEHLLMLQPDDPLGARESLERLGSLDGNPAP